MHGNASSSVLHIVHMKWHKISPTHIVCSELLTYDKNTNQPTNQHTHCKWVHAHIRNIKYVCAAGRMLSPWFNKNPSNERMHWAHAHEDKKTRRKECNDKTDTHTDYAHFIYLAIIYSTACLSTCDFMCLSWETARESGSERMEDLCFIYKN